MKDFKVSISLRTIFILIITGLALLLAFELRSVIISIFFAYIISAGIRPIVETLQSKRFSKGAAITLVYSVFFAIVFILGFFLFSTAFSQARAFFLDIDTKLANFTNFIQTNVPVLNEYVSEDQFQNLGNLNGNALENINIEQLTQFFGNVGLRGINILGSLFGGVLTLFVILMLSIYMVRSKESVYKPVLRLLPDKSEKRLIPVFEKIDASLGSWVVGQLALMLIIGIITYFLLLIPGVFDPNYTLSRYALVIAIIAGLLEGIPSIGPIITLVIAVLAAILSGAGIPVIIFIVLAFIILQQLEAILIVPVVMKRAVDLHPILSIIGAIAGLQLGGPIGALLSIPIVAMLQIVVLEVSREYRK